MGYEARGEVDRNANQDAAIEELMGMFAVKVVPKGELADVGQ